MNNKEIISCERYITWHSMNCVHHHLAVMKWRLEIRKRKKRYLRRGSKGIAAWPCWFMCDARVATCDNVFFAFCQNYNEPLRTHSRRTPNVLTDCSNMSGNYWRKCLWPTKRNKKAITTMHVCAFCALVRCERKKWLLKLNVVFLLSFFMFSPYWASRRLDPCVHKRKKK